MKHFISILVYVIISFFPTMKAQVNEYAEHIAKTAVNPTDYVLGKLRDYRIVAIGEDHWIADHTPFFCEILRKAADSEKTRPDVVALEFGNELDQKTADCVANSDTFMPDSVIKILQHAPDIYGNPYKEYFDVFKCIWEINRTLPEGEKMSIRLLDPAEVQDSFDQTSIQRGRDRDMAMFDKLRLDFTRGKKIVFYAGQGHTQHQIRGYKPRGCTNYYNYPSAGYLIKSVYPNDVFAIDLWSPMNLGLGYQTNPETGKWYEKSDGIFDKAFELNRNKPCGFDIAGSPWAEITLSEYFSAPWREGYNVPRSDDANPYNRDVMLSQLIDGIVFIKPSCEFNGGILIDIYTPDFVEVCRRRSNGKLSTPRDILLQVKKWHPLMHLPE